MTRHYDKLIRDDIPEIIEDNGETPTVRTVEGDTYEQYLLDKLQEEVDEYVEDRDVEELADILEVVHAIREFEGLTEADLEVIRERKAEKRGRFTEGIVLEQVEE